MQYTKNQIDETLSFWTEQLRNLDERRMSRQELDRFIEQLGLGEVEFEYMKKERDAQGNPTGNLVSRHARGTRKQNLIPAQQYAELQQLLNTPRAAYMIYYYDLDSNGIRQFNCNHYQRTISAPKQFKIKFSCYKRETNDDIIIANSREDAVHKFDQWCQDQEKSSSAIKEFEMLSIDEI